MVGERREGDKTGIAPSPFGEGLGGGGSGWKGLEKERPPTPTLSPRERERKHMFSSGWIHNWRRDARSASSADGPGGAAILRLQLLLLKLLILDQLSHLREHRAVCVGFAIAANQLAVGVQQPRDGLLMSVGFEID